MLRIPHCLDNRHTDCGKVVIPKRPRSTPHKHFLVLISVICQMNSRAYCSRIDKVNWKILFTSSSLEPSTFLLLAYCLSLPLFSLKLWSADRDTVFMLYWKQCFCSFPADIAFVCPGDPTNFSHTLQETWRRCAWSRNESRVDSSERDSYTVVSSNCSCPLRTELVNNACDACRLKEFKYVSWTRLLALATSWLRN
jgi:hypothetical protein